MRSWIALVKVVCASTWLQPAFFQKATSLRQSSSLPLPGETQTSSPTSSGLRPASRDHAAQPLEDLEHVVARRPAVGHEAVAVLGHALQRLLGVSAEPHRHLARLGARIDAAVGELVILALEGDAVLGPQRLHEADLLGRAHAAGVEVHAEALELDLVPADADAQPEPALAQRIERGCLLGHQGRLALRQDQHAGGEADLLGDAGQEAEQHEGIVIGGGIRAALAGRDLGGIDADHVVGGDEVVEAQPFGGLRIVAHDGRAGADVADGDGCSELHRCLPLCSVIRRPPAPSA